LASSVSRTCRIPRTVVAVFWVLARSRSYTGRRKNFPVGPDHFRLLRTRGERQRDPIRGGVFRATNERACLFRVLTYRSWHQLPGVDLSKTRRGRWANRSGAPECEARSQRPIGS